MMAPGVANLGPSDTVGRIYEGGYYTLIHIKYLSSWSHGNRKEEFLGFPHYNLMGAISWPGNQSSNPIWPKT